MCRSTESAVVRCPCSKNRSDRLLGTVISIQKHFCSMSEKEDSLAFVRVEVLDPDDDAGSSPSDLSSLPSTTSPNASSLPSTETSTNEYANVRLQDDLWNQRIQDSGSTLENLPKKHYKRSKIPAIGPKESPMYYFYISSIAIDYLNTFTKEKELGRGWKKLPINKTDGKNKIINILLALRKQDTNGIYILDQCRVLSMLSNVWGGENSGNDTTMHHNDRIRIYGLVMSMDIHRGMFQRLAEGCITRQHLDDPAFSLQQIFQTIAFAFNNEKMIIKLPNDACDVGGIENVDPNDMARIRITRDCK